MCKSLQISWLMPRPTCPSITAYRPITQWTLAYFSGYPKCSKLTICRMLEIFSKRTNHEIIDSDIKLWIAQKKPGPGALCAPVWVFALLSSSLSVWQLWDTAIGDTRKNILNKTCFSHLWVCTEHTGWVLNNGVMMPALKHTQSWPKLSGMSGKNTDTAAATFCRSQAWYL